MTTIETLEEIERFVASGHMRLLYLSRPDCGVCTALLPKVKEMLAAYEGIEGAYVDLDRLPAAAGKYSVFTIPGIILYIQGKETIREARYVSVEDLQARIDRYHELLFS